MLVFGIALLHISTVASFASQPSNKNDLLNTYSTGEHGSEEEREKMEEGAGTSTDPIRSALLNVIE